MAANWNPQIVQGLASWNGNAPLVTQRQLSTAISTVNGNISSAIQTLSTSIQNISTTIEVDLTKWATYPAIHDVNFSTNQSGAGLFNLNSVNTGGFQNVNVNDTVATDVLNAETVNASVRGNIGNQIIGLADFNVYGGNNLATDSAVYIEGGLTVAGGESHGVSMGCLPFLGVNTNRIDILPTGATDIIAPLAVAILGGTGVTVDSLGGININAVALTTVGSEVRVLLQSETVQTDSYYVDIVNSASNGQGKLYVDNIYNNETQQGQLNNFSIYGSNATMSNYVCTHCNDPGYLDNYSKYFQSTYPYPYSHVSQFGFITIGSSNGLYYSTDASNFSTLNVYKKTSITTRFVTAHTVEKYNTFWIAGADEASPYTSLIYSLNGINWNNCSFPSGFIPFDARFGVLSNSIPGWLCGGTSKGGSLMWSLDGINWDQSGFINPPGVQTTGLAYGNGQWVASASNGTSANLKYSGDGFNWSNCSGTFTTFANNVFYSSNDNLFFAVGYNSAGGGNSIKKSADGITWSNTTNSFANQGYTVSYNGSNLYVAAGSDGTTLGSLKYSSDGSTWTNAVSGGFSNYANSVAYNQVLGKWIAVGYHGVGINPPIEVSVDGCNWSNTGSQYSQTGVDVDVGWVGKEFISSIAFIGLSSQTVEMRFKNSGVDVFNFTSTSYNQIPSSINIPYSLFKISQYNEQLTNTVSPSTTINFSTITTSGFVDIIPTYQTNILGSTIISTYTSTFNFSTLSSIGSTLQQYYLTTPSRVYNNKGSISVSAIPQPASTMISSVLTGTTDFITTCYDFTINNYDYQFGNIGCINLNASTLGFGVSTFESRNTTLGFSYPIQFFKDTQVNGNFAATNINADVIYVSTLFANNFEVALSSIYFDELYCSSFTASTIEAYDFISSPQINFYGANGTNMTACNIYTNDVLINNNLFVNQTLTGNQINTNGLSTTYLWADTSVGNNFTLQTLATSNLYSANSFNSNDSFTSNINVKNTVTASTLNVSSINAYNLNSSNLIINNLTVPGEIDTDTLNVSTINSYNINNSGIAVIPTFGGTLTTFQNNVKANSISTTYLWADTSVGNNFTLNAMVTKYAYSSNLFNTALITTNDININATLNANNGTVSNIFYARNLNGDKSYISSLTVSSIDILNGSVNTSFVSQTSLTSTTNGLGTLGYLSSGGGGGGITSNDLTSTVIGLGTYGYISTSQLTSTIQGLGTYGYISTLQLTSTTQGLQQSQKISTVVGSTITFNLTPYTKPLISTNTAAHVYTYFNYTGGKQKYNVKGKQQRIHIWGAAGGDWPNSDGSKIGGAGGYLMIDTIIPIGTNLILDVGSGGKSGLSGASGGYPNGGTGTTSGGGGGSSAIYDGTNLYAVAGGGGGGGINAYTGGKAGTSANGSSGAGPNGGTGGTITGTGGTGGNAGGNGIGGNGSGPMNASGTNGSGGSVVSGSYVSGGGGGYAGGGGGGNSAGGGGSSYVNMSYALSVVYGTMTSVTYNNTSPQSASDIYYLVPISQAPFNSAGGGYNGNNGMIVIEDYNPEPQIYINGSSITSYFDYNGNLLMNKPTLFSSINGIAPGLPYPITTNFPIDILGNANIGGNLLLGNISSQTAIRFYGLQGNYNNTAIVEQSTGIGTQELLLFKGSSINDKIRLQTTGSINFEAGVTGALYSNNIANAVPTVVMSNGFMDVAGTTRSQILSSLTLNTGTLTFGIINLPLIPQSAFSSMGQITLGNYSTPSISFNPTIGVFKNVSTVQQYRSYQYFNYTGAKQYYTVKGTIQRIHIWGAAAGDWVSSSPDKVGGAGAYLSIDMMIPIGTTLTIDVGGGGAALTGIGGYPNGGTGATSGGGGGSSAIYDGTNLYCVAGGGGGGSINAYTGGKAGTSTNGFSGSGTGGTGGTISGSGGTGGTNGNNGSGPMNASGGNGNGGNLITGNGPGGGGGYGGGGAGGSSSGGGGGSSYANPRFTISVVYGTMTSVTYNNTSPESLADVYYISPISQVKWVSGLTTDNGNNGLIVIEDGITDDSIRVIGTNNNTSLSGYSAFDTKGSLVINKPYYQGRNLASSIMLDISGNSAFNGNIGIGLNYNSTPIYTLDTQGYGRFSTLTVGQPTGLGISSIGPATSNFVFSLTSGDAYKPSGGSWNNISDRRMKQNIVNANLDICYKTIKELPLRRFEYNTLFQQQSAIKDKNVLGFIAQEVLETFPKSITKTKDDYLLLNTDQINMAVYGALQKTIYDKEITESTLIGVMNRLNILENNKI